MMNSSNVLIVIIAIDVAVIDITLIFRILNKSLPSPSPTFAMLKSLGLALWESVISPSVGVAIFMLTIISSTVGSETPAVRRTR